MIKEIRTSINGERLKEMPDKQFDGYDGNLKSLVVDSSRSFQTHLGFGGAFTESAAYALSKLTPKLRSEAIAAYFGKGGLKYSLGRVHINSCDFSLSNYTYLPDGATDLSGFDLSREDKLVVPLILDAKKEAKSDLNILASPWSPPPHFKDTLEMNYGGKLKEKYAPLWAEYYCRFILEMRKRGIDIRYVTVQNEPLSSQTWDSCVYTAQEERDFIAKHLAPSLKKNRLDDVNIVIWDHNRDCMVERANVIYADPECFKNVWGLGYHWYVNGHHDDLTVLKTLYPEKHILFTEGCVEYKGDMQKGSWHSAERYGINIINDFNNYCEGWIDWNLFLDEKGGPNHAGNFCEAPIMADTVNNAVIYNPSYYYIAHFAKYIEKGAKRLLAVHNAGEGIYLTAYSNPNGDTAVVVMNIGWIKRLALIVDKKGMNVSLPDHSITTYIIKNQSSINSNKEGERKK